MPRSRASAGLFWILLCAAGLLPGGGAGAQTEEEQARAELEQLQQQIELVSRELASARTQLSDQQEQLRSAELRLGQLQQEISANLAAIAATEAELETLGERQLELEQARDAQQVRIGTELRAAWQMGQQGTLKVLLNQESPHTVARAMAYYRYFFHARNNLVAEYRTTLEELAAVRAQSETAAAELLAQQATLEAQQREVLASRQEREQLIAALAASISSQDEELAQLQRDRQELEELLQAIEQAMVELQLPESYQPFASTRGTLAWPVDGRRGNSFGSSRGAGGMRWHGINLAADEGTAVRAIHHGRVVYADWLRGSGLLLILDHGDGYMSLYAHNQSLLKEVGQWVAPGTPISTVGNSGGLDQAGLYFEIRKDGKPVDPVVWCR
ncbi:peptidoglycan DD-metalloendopeptidase family protein [Haliea sp. E1-2-M8]|uniref:murein hydrolase activator EnvC family protein n=1 Tax=Haliea sp. E1-2-M8 TaxID=3064706 RepID=UPI00271FCFED|nr:peptidoglycan DD-metalloendopeptidase family protein [Haliea sp. E1-2-M8]MDO8860919.1 peptidoglycan DD-metalloendopeptidase family protein [Haliea sp. E1-2-M8]